MAEAGTREETDMRVRPSKVLEPLPLAVALADASAPELPLIYVNAAFETLTGYTRARAIGLSLCDLEDRNDDSAQLASLREAVDASAEAAAEMTLISANGTKIQNRVKLSALKSEDDADGPPAVYVASFQERGSSSDEAEGFNRLAELQHRVKNHLSMVISLIRSHALKSGLKADLGALGSRVETLQLLYEELAGPTDADSDTEEIPLGAYLSRIASSVAHLAGRPGVRNAVHVDETTVSVGLAGRVGLLVNEMLTNSYQHAFEGRATGLVETRVQRLSEGRVRVTVADDGIGLPDGVEWPTADRLGSRIVSGILNGLSAQYDVRTGATGTIIIIDFPIDGATPGD